MSLKRWPANIFFVLVEPTEPGNIGAAARALKNMGFHRLELVNPVDYLSHEAKSMACQAKDVLEKATVYSTFEQAISGKSLVVGTTRRLGSKRGLILPLPEGTERIAKAAVKNEVAVLFGNEHYGLTNREIDECGFLLTIPSNTEFPSLNLAQSVMLVAYELSRQLFKPEFPKAVNNKELQELYKRIRTTLRLLKYQPEGDKDLEAGIMRHLKRLFGRAGLTPWELNMLHGLCRQVEQNLEKRDPDSRATRGKMGSSRRTRGGPKACCF